MGSSTEQAVETIKICAHDREPASKLCNGCHDGLDAEGRHVETVWYCNAKCQKADWKFHKNDCRKIQARRSLYHGAETVMLALFRHVERTIDLNVGRLEDKGNTLYIREGRKEQSIVGSVPAEHFNSDRDKQAAMAWMGRSISEDFVQIVIETILKSIQPELTVVQIPKVKFLRRVVFIGLDGLESDSSKSEHIIFKITINEDEEYALDVTGAQFGFYHPLTPWASYRQNRIERIGATRPPRRLEESHSLPSKGSSRKKGRDDKGKALNAQLAKTLGSALESWEAKNKEKVSAVFKLHEGAFRKRQGELLDLIDKHIGARKK